MKPVDPSQILRTCEHGPSFGPAVDRRARITLLFLLKNRPGIEKSVSCQKNINQFLKAGLFAQDKGCKLGGRGLHVWFETAHQSSQIAVNAGDCIATMTEPYSKRNDKITGSGFLCEIVRSLDKTLEDNGLIDQTRPAP